MGLKMVLGESSDNAGVSAILGPWANLIGMDDELFEKRGAEILQNTPVRIGD